MCLVVATRNRITAYQVCAGSRPQEKQKAEERSTAVRVEDESVMQPLAEDCRMAYGSSYIAERVKVSLPAVLFNTISCFERDQRLDELCFPERAETHHAMLPAKLFQVCHLRDAPLPLSATLHCFPSVLPLVLRARQHDAQPGQSVLEHVW